ncbi:MAG: DNA-directed RNA polymerase subunit omega [Candidatus Melainabacteria bacterium]|nr:DNA-directed RNA polymerase subunit omega [Candidatus Melainabacteria bacterium]MBI3308758.1 DNA-directed RNA polymerase subunit omega [Candidatus Melainabacteria bacterium]
MIRLLGDLLENSDNRFELVLNVADLAKQIKNETKELEGTTNPIIEALQEIAAQSDGTLLVDAGRLGLRADK